MTYNRFIAVVTTCALGASVLLAPVSAYADQVDNLQAQLDSANAQLNEYYSQAEEISEQVNATQEQLNQTNAEIETKQVELADAKDVLSDRVSSDYKTGGVNLLQVLVGSTSPSDFISRIYLATKVANSDAKVIQEVKTIQAELDTKKSEQEQLLSEKQSQQAELDAKVSETESYVSSLSTEVQEAIAAAQAAAQAEAEAAAAAAEQAAAAETTGEGETAENTQGESNSGSSSASNVSPYTGGSLSESQRNAIVSAAWSKVGCAYVYGATGSSSFDCSGFVQYCYAAAGVGLPRDSYSQGATGSNTSNPQAGDIVCWGWHVGIYLGGGMMIDAGNPSTGVVYRSVFGSPWYQSL